MDTNIQTAPVETPSGGQGQEADLTQRWSGDRAGRRLRHRCIHDRRPAAATTAARRSADKPAANAPAQPAAPKPAANQKPPASQIGKPVRDGKFEFTVKSVKCGISKVGGEYLSTKAQGQFCAVQLKIENIGDEPQSMFADNQYAFDGKNRKFSADSEASIYDDRRQVLWEEINPGNSVKGKVYFDVPKGVKAHHLAASRLDVLRWREGRSLISRESQPPGASGPPGSSAIRGATRDRIRNRQKRRKRRPPHAQDHPRPRGHRRRRCPRRHRRLSGRRRPGWFVARLTAVRPRDV